MNKKGITELRDDLERAVKTLVNDITEHFERYEWHQGECDCEECSCSCEDCETCDCTGEIAHDCALDGERELVDEAQERIKSDLRAFQSELKEKFKDILSQESDDE